MADESIENLRCQLQKRFGSRFKYYGPPPTEERGFAFNIDGIPATFSAIALDGTLRPNEFDIQIESLPPGEYIYTRTISLAELLDLMEVFSRPQPEWPGWYTPD